MWTVSSLLIFFILNLIFFILNLIFFILNLIFFHFEFDFFHFEFDFFHIEHHSEPRISRCTKWPNSIVYKCDSENSSVRIWIYIEFERENSDLY